MEHSFIKQSAKKIATTALLFMGVSMLPLSASAAAQFGDVNSGTSYAQAIYWAYDKGIISGYGNGNFGPDNCVRRGELLKMIVRYALPNITVGAQGSEPNFSDVYTSDWYYPYVKEARYRNYVSGYPDGTFRPNICVNRAEAMKIAYGALLTNQPLGISGTPLYYDNKYISDASASDWYSPYAYVFFKNRLVGTDHTVYDAAASYNGLYAIKFFPGNAMSRKEVAQMLYLVNAFKGNPNNNPTTLLAPTLNAPANNATYSNGQNVNVNFNWSGAQGATSYNLMIRVAQNNSYFVDQKYYTTSATYPITVVSGTQGYYWKVRSYDANGNYKDSNENYFSFGSNTLSAPVLTSPANGTNYPTSGNITFAWAAANGASSYRVQIRDASSSSYFYDQPVTGNGNTYTYWANAGSSQATYYWRVVAYNSNGGSVASNEGYYTVGTSSVLGTASLVYPANGAVFSPTPSALTVTWSPAVGATHYDVMVLYGGSSSYKAYGVNTTSSSNISYALPSSDFPAGGFNYINKWKVRSFNAANSWTDSPEYTFNFNNVQFLLVAPTPVAPSSNQVLTNFPRVTNFQWTSVSGAASYQLELGINADGYATPSYYTSNTTSLTQTLPGDNTYRFRVRAVSSNGTAGSWSNYVYFSYAT